MYDGNEMMEQLSKDLDFPFKRNGSLVVCLHEDEMPGLEALYKRGIANGVPGLRILNRGRTPGNGAEYFR